MSWLDRVTSLLFWFCTINVLPIAEFSTRNAYVYICVCVNTDFMTVESLKLEGLCMLMWFQRLNVTHSLPAQKITCCHTVTCLIPCSVRQLTSHPDRDYPKQCTLAASTSGSVVQKVMCIIILCSICFALSSLAPISIWTSLCLAFSKHIGKSVL